jgi:hypothetical protein
MHNPQRKLPYKAIAKRCKNAAILLEKGLICRGKSEKQGSKIIAYFSIFLHIFTNRFQRTNNCRGFGVSSLKFSCR